MKGVWNIVLKILLAVTGILFYRWFVERRKLRLAEIARKIELEREEYVRLLSRNRDEIRAAGDIFASHLDGTLGYFSYTQLKTWQNTYNKLALEINDKPYQGIGLSEPDERMVRTFLDYFAKASSLREKYNEQFIATELVSYEAFFDNVEGRKLDLQQRTAVVSDEDNNIVIAGAGSGKTTTIVGKVAYVIDRYKVSPEEILLISFTDKSAKTLAERIGIEGVEVKTFHKFGKDVILEADRIQPSISDAAQFSHLITKFFKELVIDPEYLEKVTIYFTDFLKTEKSQFEFKAQGDYIQYLQDQNFKTYKQQEIPYNGKTTFRREIVKSVEECKIANFLLFNNLEYEYEYPYEHDTANESFKQYRPDFTVTQDGKKIYIEHFGVSRNGEVPDWFEGKDGLSATGKYQTDMAWKRELHLEKGTTLIETYSYEMIEGVLYDNLTQRLNDAGIVIDPMPAGQIWDIINEVASDEVQELVQLFGTFITLMKSNNFSIDELSIKNEKVENKIVRNRNMMFINLVRPIFHRYESYLVERREIDFSDMINKAATLIESGKFSRKFRYVIIDEFQDISVGRYQLVRAIRKMNPMCRLFCVGDDWQSIYRFTGSDIALFKNFEDYFGYTVQSRIETTYRYNEPLIGLSGDFILKNPNQTKKQLKGLSATKKTDYEIRYSADQNHDDTYVLKQIFDELLSSGNIAEKEILVLGRYNQDINRIKNEVSVFDINHGSGQITYRTNISGRSEEISARFLTVHRSKGLEGHIVIILNCNSGKYGFPSEISDDPVLNLLLSDADQFENGEERRLFYVAMTRAKDKVYFVADSSSKSKFIIELENERNLSPTQKCPFCKIGDVMLKKSGATRTGNRYEFFGCTNFRHGCEYTNTKWINGKKEAAH